MALSVLKATSIKSGFDLQKISFSPQCCIKATVGLIIMYETLHDTVEFRNKGDDVLSGS